MWSTAALIASLCLTFWPNRALPAAVSEIVPRFHVAVSALDADDNPRAKTIFSELTPLAPEEPAAWFNLGLAEFRLGGLEAAEAALARAAALAPENAQIEALRATLEQHRGRPADAQARLRRALELDPALSKARYELYKSLKRSRDADPAMLREHLDQLLRDQPQNLVLLLERAGVALAENDAAELVSLLNRLKAFSATWTGLPSEQFEALKDAVAKSDARGAKRRLALLGNVLKPEPAYRDSLAKLQSPTGVIAEPIRTLLSVPSPRSSRAPADMGIRFSTRAFDGSTAERVSFVVSAWLTGDASQAVFMARNGALNRHGLPKLKLEFPGVAGETMPGRSAVAAFDWNYDFRTDFMLVGPGGLKLFAQTESGGFDDVTSELGLKASILNADYFGVWPLDLEADGDLDLVLALRQGALGVLRNNGDKTLTPVAPFAGASKVREFVWSDLDGDGDPDAAFVDASGQLKVFANQRGGRFDEREAPREPGSVRAIATGDVDDDGAFDLVVLTADGRLLRVSHRDEGPAWSVAELARWKDLPEAVPGDALLFAADVDNNGGLDLLASAGGQTRIWLGGGETTAWVEGPAIALALTDVADLNQDGRLDALGIGAGGKAMWAENSGERAYGWQVIRLAANPNGGDQRINSLAIGSEVEIRTGLQAQRRLSAGRPVHFGLGEQRLAEVARIVWPNGSVQTAYDLPVNTRVNAEQRLKGSCPFVFAYDGEAMRFVTDFLWRSPLGLRINAQDTAGQLQTEDWIRIRGDQLKARDGIYEIRITADLWETHFFDHVSLMVVDHPASDEIFVDERFSHPQPPLKVNLTTQPVPLSRVWDHRGLPVADRTRTRDGRYVDTFALGRFQGVAEPHWIEAELSDDVPDGPGLVLVANGWVYPTDSSLNVAMGQGRHERPQGMTLEVADGRGGWRTARADLGFPAGKNKTVLIDLDGVFTPGAPRRFRLRTNLEIYWDSLAWALRRPGEAVETRRLAADVAELRYRGFSAMRQASRRAPDLPVYAERVGTQQRWRDLEGFHTRFGDVRELLAAIDDRYVIMNAGDELVLRFPAPSPPPTGWTRDFVLIGDGWVKDGDYNTVASKTVLPLPHHQQSLYPVTAGRLEDDPVYRRFPADWLNYHTRYVAPDRFRRGLRP